MDVWLVLVVYLSYRCLTCFCCVLVRVMSEDPYNTQCLPIHIAVLVELKKSKGVMPCPILILQIIARKCYCQTIKVIGNEKEICNYNIYVIFLTCFEWFIIYIYIDEFFSSDLFYLSHKLVDLYPNDPVRCIISIQVYPLDAGFSIILF